MLAPNVNPVMDNLARSYSTITRVDAFAHAAMNSAIGKLSPDPDWLGPIRQELTLLNDAGAQWQLKKPTLWAPLLTQFPDYASLFSGFAAVSNEVGNDKEAWIKLLSELSQSLVRATNASRAAEREFTLQVNNLNNVQTVFDSSLKKAWTALASEEEAMVAMAEQIGALQERVGTLAADMSAGAISSGKSLIQSTVTITYAVLIAASVSVPYLTIAGMLFTIGKGAYDLIVTDQKIHDAIDKITELRVAMSEEAQAAAMSKAIVQLITAFDITLAAVGRQLPALSEMWTAENQKVQGTIHALQAGAVPRDMIELVSMPSAAATWNSLAGFVTKLLATPAMGRPVTLTTAKS
jgi:hypothetical protein